MANPRTRFPENAAGDFFVDATCIDCDACRQIAPAVFAEGENHSFVHDQPRSESDRLAALHALLSCPTGSIGCGEADDPKRALGDFPLLIEAPVSYCGFNSPKSYGGNSYFIQHPEGNWLIDSPKYIAPLVGRFAELGGIANIFLTHQDDVADAERYAEKFGARRFIHREELDSQPDAEVVLEGTEPTELAPGFVCIPTPGHTAGHCALLLNGKFLFTGDHLYWDRQTERLGAFRDYCWDSWPNQTESMSRLLQYEFEWVLPGHGQRVRLGNLDMRDQLTKLVESMKVTP